MQQFEMGGYLPLELHRGKSFFSDVPADRILQVNTGRTALWCAIQSLKVKKVFVPYYYCPDIIDMLSRMDVELSFYRISEDFIPVGIKAEPNAAVILVNYFGVMGQDFQALVDMYPNVIIDNAHAFFTPPVFREGVMNIYSCRKFFGVSDGAYLIGTGISKPVLQQDVSSGRSGHLLVSLELGTNAAYMDNKHNEQVLGEGKYGMSLLTQRILEGVDYDYVARKRRENYRYLHERLKHLQQLSIRCDNPVPYAYPLLLDRDLHKQLVQRRIYVPLLWAQLLEEKWNGTLEQRYSANILPLPLDQRYGKEELEKMAEQIESCVYRMENMK